MQASHFFSSYIFQHNNPQETCSVAGLSSLIYIREGRSMTPSLAFPYNENEEMRNQF